MLIGGNYNLQSRHTGINSQWKVKHAGKNGRNVPPKKEVTLSKQGLKDAYMPLFSDLHVMFAQFISQSKFHVTLSTPGSVQLKKAYLYSFWRMYHHQQSADTHVTEIGSLYPMIKMKKITSFSLHKTAVPLAKNHHQQQKKPHLFSLVI